MGLAQLLPPSAMCRRRRRRRCLPAVPSIGAQALLCAYHDVDGDEDEGAGGGRAGAMNSRGGGRRLAAVLAAAAASPAERAQQGVEGLVPRSCWAQLRAHSPAVLLGEQLATAQRHVPVRRPLRPATCRFDWDFPMRRVFLSRNIEGATDAGRAAARPWRRGSPVRTALMRAVRSDWN
jgi:hypothetical protein